MLNPGGEGVGGSSFFSVSRSFYNEQVLLLLSGIKPVSYVLLFLFVWPLMDNSFLLLDWDWVGVKDYFLARSGLSCVLWDLVPWQGIEARPPALRTWSFSHWTARGQKLMTWSSLLPSTLQLPQNRAWECRLHLGTKLGLLLPHRPETEHERWAILGYACSFSTNRSFHGCIRGCNPPPSNSMWDMGCEYPREVCICPTLLESL